MSLGSIAVKDLEQKHPDWTELNEYWQRIDLLYRGGWAIKQQASLFLEKRPMEPSGVYSARAAGFTYQNILGTALGWYLSALSKSEAQILLKQGGTTIEQDDQFTPFLEDCDRKQTRLVDMAKKWFESAAKNNVSYTLIDLPTSDRNLNLRQQKESGALNPYLINFDPIQVTNWGEDRYGNLSWILISTEDTEQQFGQGAVITDRWHYFDTKEYRVYESQRDGGTTAADSRTAQLVDQGPHALAGLNRVPVRRIALPQGLQLAYRAYPQLLDHVNQDNDLKWMLRMGCLPVPVITGEYDESPVISETAYIKLPQGSTFGYSEPEGKSYETASGRIDSLREEVYRQMYLQAQGRNSSATADASSGYSKELDMMPAADVLNEFGRMLHAALRGTILDVAFIAGRKDVTVEIQGLEFAEHDEMGDIASAQAVTDLDIPSDSFDKFVKKKAVHSYARGADEDTLRMFDDEIDAAPTKSELAQQELAQQQLQFRTSLDKGIANLGVKEAA